MIRILLADDHDLMRRGIRDLLEEEASFEVCGEASNGQEAVELALRLKPDIVVLDLTMPEKNGLETIQQLRQELPQTELLVFSMHDSDELIREVFAAGARGYVLKSDAARHLVEARTMLECSAAEMAAYQKARGACLEGKGYTVK